MRKRRVLLLRPFEFGDAVIRIARAEKGQSVVDALADRIRSQRQRLAELLYGLFVGGRVFVKRFAEITALPEAVVAGGTQLREGKPCASDGHKRRYEPRHGLHECFPLRPPDSPAIPLEKRFLTASQPAGANPATP